MDYISFTASEIFTLFIFRDSYTTLHITPCTRCFNAKTCCGNYCVLLFFINIINIIITYIFSIDLCHFELINLPPPPRFFYRKNQTSLYAFLYIILTLISVMFSSLPCWQFVADIAREFGQNFKETVLLLKVVHNAWLIVHLALFFVKKKLLEMPTFVRYPLDMAPSERIHVKVFWNNEWLCCHNVIGTSSSTARGMIGLFFLDLVLALFVFLHINILIPIHFLFFFFFVF